MEKQMKPTFAQTRKVIGTSKEGPHINVAPPASKRGLCFEQVCVLVVRDRNGSTLCQVAGQGNLSKVKAGKVLDGKLDNVTTLCSDASLTLKAYTKESGINHVVLNQSKKVRVKGAIFKTSTPVTVA